MHQWAKIIGGDAAQTGSGPGSYNIRQSVWHVNCCNPEINGGGGWGIFNSLLGWTNSATYGSVISYNVYWLAVITAFSSMRSYEKQGHWPFLKPKAKAAEDIELDDRSSVGGEPVEVGKEAEANAQMSVVREVPV